jgi:hypothetical protein
MGTKWGVAVGKELILTNGRNGEDRRLALDSRVLNCAQQIRADFGRHFEHRLDKGNYPWGLKRKRESSPVRVEMPEHTAALVDRLNSGPDMIAEMPAEHRSRIPDGQHFSWIRVPTEPAEYDRKKLEKHLYAVAAWEIVCSHLVHKKPEVQEQLLLGVKMPNDDQRLRDAYLFPKWGENPVMNWSVRRPDMHVNGDKLVASENDEMPGGFTDLVHIDLAYGLHADRWQHCWDWLFEEGPLLFVVSDDWSAAYIPSTRWLVEYLQSTGRQAFLVTTTELDKVELDGEGVSFDGIRIGTVWRQFPVFETEGKLAELVFAAQDGRVRMVPEFAHFGNKTWFSLFRQYEDFFRNDLSPENFSIIDQLLPRSTLVTMDGDFTPLSVDGHSVSSFEELVALGDQARSKLVLKVTGANDQAARSFGVFIGAAKPRSDWQAWLKKRKQLGEPFIVQERFETSKEKAAVFNTKTRAMEAFRCKVLIRPWMVGGRLISTHTCMTPHYTTVVHGMVDMAVQPLIFV